MHPEALRLVGDGVRLLETERIEKKLVLANPQEDGVRDNAFFGLGSDVEAPGNFR